jgi:hypothetical protein
MSDCLFVAGLKDPKLFQLTLNLLTDGLYVEYIAGTSNGYSRLINVNWNQNLGTMAGKIPRRRRNCSTRICK